MYQTHKDEGRGEDGRETEGEVCGVWCVSLPCIRITGRWREETHGGPLAPSPPHPPSFYLSPHTSCSTWLGERGDRKGGRADDRKSGRKGTIRREEEKGMVVERDRCIVRGKEETEEKEKQETGRKR